MTEIARPKLVSINVFQDHRGLVEHYASTELPGIKRIYFVTPAKVGDFRGWHGHKFESKIFRCAEGEFDVHLARVTDWEAPQSTASYNYRLSASGGEMLLVPAGHANAMISRIPGSRMLVMSDRTLGESQLDDYRYDADAFPLG